MKRIMMEMKMKVNQKWILESAEPVAPEKQTTVREAGGSLQESHGGREWDVVLIVEGPGASGDYRGKYRLCKWHA